MLLLVDNLSPFTPDILGCLKQLGIECVCLKFSEVSEGDLARCGKVILSGRRNNSKEINVANSAIVRHCQEQGKPILGICYGAEIIALTLGGSIRKMPSHVQGPTDLSVSGPNPLTGGKKSISVYESHGYYVARLPATFRSLASSQYCQHELFASTDKKIFGTQFHPEKSGSEGLMMLQNFANL